MLSIGETDRVENIRHVKALKVEQQEVGNVISKYFGS